MTSPADLIAAQVRSIVRDHDRDGWPTCDVYRHVIGLVERPLIEAVLRQYRGNQSHAAVALGISRNTLAKKLRGHGIR